MNEHESPPLKRPDLVPRPDPQRTADFNDALDIVGRHGTGLLFVHSPTLRLVSGYECRWDGEAFVPHPTARHLVSGKKCMPYCHHGFLPHLLVPRDRDRVDLYFFLGAWGERSDWGDGTEAAYPQYELVRDRAHRDDWRWSDGCAVEVTAVGPDGREASFSSLQWSFLHGPGYVWFTPLTPHPLFEHVVILVPSTPTTALVHVYLRHPDALARLDARPMLAELVRPPATHRAPVDFLHRPPFGWGAFHWLPLTPTLDPRGGVRLVSDAADLRLVMLTEGHEVEVRLAPVEPAACARAAGPLMKQDARLPEAACFDVTLVARPDADRVVTFRLGAERLHPRPEEVQISPFRHAFMVPRDGRHPLRFSSGNRFVDGYVRWSRITARSLIWPNGVAATGALGYGAMSHVAQDIPFVYPLYLMEHHHLFRRAARKNVALVWESADRGAGITDHPSDGLDFAFLPLDPEHARVWKETGAAGLWRQIQMLGRYGRWTGDDERTARWYERARSVVTEHYLPFRPDHPRWTVGLETQSRLFTLVEAPAALRALATMADLYGTDPDRRRFEREVEAVLDHLDRPDTDGGYRLTRPLTSADGQTLPPGLLVEPERASLTGADVSFDVLLVNALALWREALRPERRAAAARHLADRGSPWWVEGAGLAKSYGGRRGVWFWHNALALGALLRCRELDDSYVDTAWQLLEWMGRSLVDLNGRGCPGEELQGGDHAMAIGCLGTPFLIEGLLRPEPTPSGLEFSPVLPSAVDEVVIQNLLCRGRLYHACFRRRTHAPDEIVAEITETRPE